MTTTSSSSSFWQEVSRLRLSGTNVVYFHFSSILKSASLAESQALPTLFLSRFLGFGLTMKSSCVTRKEDQEEKGTPILLVNGSVHRFIYNRQRITQ